MVDDNKAPDPKRDDDAWIEHVVGIAGQLGFNKMRLRWKLIRWQEARRRKARHREQVIAHITYAHKTCHECGSVQDKDEAICTHCGAKLASRRFQVLERIGLAMPVPLSMSTLLAVALIVAYGRVWIASGGGLAGPPGPLLIEFGGRWAPLMSEEPWRLVTAVFLHAGPLHLAFNVLAIATVGPRVEELYGRATMLGLFVATGVIANLATLQVGPLGVGIGASGGVMGLIGAVAACGHRMGTGYGRGLRDSMLKWLGYTLVYGFMLHADNWAHLFGALSGAAFGFAIKPHAWTRRELFPVRALVGAVGLVATFGAVLLIFTRTPAPREETAARSEEMFDEDSYMEGSIDACIKFYAGDTKGAIAAATKVFSQRHETITERIVASMCRGMQQLRDNCHAMDAGGSGQRSGSADDDPEDTEMVREMCKKFRPLLDRLPASGGGSAR